MKTYLITGVMKDIPYFLDESMEFGIQRIEDTQIGEKKIYPGDYINYEIDCKLVSLYDLFRDILFEDVAEYYNELASMPVWIQQAGQDSDCNMSAELFSECILKSDIPNLYRHLYLVDCQFLIGTVQNLLCAMEDAFISYYVRLSSFSIDNQLKELENLNGTMMLSSEDAIQTSAYIETYFTKAYSVLDVFCKICYEIQHIQAKFESYQKTKSKDILWGARKKLIINEIENTIFEKCELISYIEAIRNEIVHNGTWELKPKIFVRFKEGKEQERYLLFPDMNQGHLSTVINRRHFFSSYTKTNDLLLQIHREFKERLLNTIDVIMKMYR